MENQLEEEIHYPYIVFRLDGVHYCVNSRYVATIMQLPKYEALPQAPRNVTGIFMYRNEVVEMFDLRSAFHMPSLSAECETFTQMLEDRKQDHIRWVRALEESIQTGEQFTLATDPHMCAFGKWYDGYKTENREVAFHLRKIEEPHEKLHRAALDVDRCRKDCDNCTRSECLKKALERVKNEYAPKILNLLDEAKDLFRATVYHEMVFVLGESAGLGIVVDEVLSVEELTGVEDRGRISAEHENTLIAGIRRSERMDGVILELDVPSVLISVGKTVW